MMGRLYTLTSCCVHCDQQQRQTGINYSGVVNNNLNTRYDVK